jgi:glycosyltransferase involved in cell wall biosynthesis
MEVSGKSISWVVNTRNKLPFLRESLNRLLAEVGEHEEVIVIDGGSTDGTKEHLHELLRAGKISHCASEPDVGEGHGWNKGLLRATGAVVKIISDDDAFDFNAIRACQAYMQQNNDVDLIATNGGSATADGNEEIGLMNYRPYVDRWKQERSPFGFCGLGLMFRRASLPVIGLFHPSIARLDAEFGLRVTSGRAKLHWYTGCTYVRILNSSSNSNTRAAQIAEESRRLEAFYGGQPLDTEPPRVSLRDRIRSLKHRMQGSVPRTAEVSTPQAKAPPSVQDLFDRCTQWFQAQTGAAEFLCPR